MQALENNRRNRIITGQKTKRNCYIAELFVFMNSQHIVVCNIVIQIVNFYFPKCRIYAGNNDRKHPFPFALGACLLLYITFEMVRYLFEYSRGLMFFLACQTQLLIRFAIIHCWIDFHYHQVPSSFSWKQQHCHYSYSKTGWKPIQLKSPYRSFSILYWMVSLYALLSIFRRFLSFPFIHWIPRVVNIVPR